MIEPSKFPLNRRDCACILTNFVVNYSNLFYTYIIHSMRNTRGQSLLELAAVITLVTLGIFFAGPTIIRSINAHFKLWDDSIQDSYTDPMQKPPLIQDGSIPSTCVCTDWQWAAGQRCGVSPCNPQEHLESKLCNPAGCGLAGAVPCTGGTGVRCISAVERCVQDLQCCDIFVDTATCGTGGSLTDTYPAGCGAINPPTCTEKPDCPIGQRLQQKPCGGGT